MTERLSWVLNLTVAQNLLSCAVMCGMLSVALCEDQDKGSLNLVCSFAAHPGPADQMAP